jgi:hypothetical protein
LISQKKENDKFFKKIFCHWLDDIKILAKKAATTTPIGIETTPATHPDVTKTKITANRFIQPKSFLNGVPDPNLTVTTMCPKKQRQTIAVKSAPQPVQHKKRF